MTAPPATGPPPAEAEPGGGAGRQAGVLLARFEDGAVTAALVLLALLPVVNVVMRLAFGGGLAVTTEYVRHLTLWVALLAGIVTTRQGAHLALSSGLHQLPSPWGDRTRAAAGALSVLVTTALAASALSLLLLAFDPERRVGGVPIRAAVAILPAGFAAMAVRFVGAAFQRRWCSRWWWRPSSAPRSSCC